MNEQTTEAETKMLNELSIAQSHRADDPKKSPIKLPSKLNHPRTTRNQAKTAITMDEKLLMEDEIGDKTSEVSLEDIEEYHDTIDGAKTSFQPLLFDKWDVPGKMPSEMKKQMSDNLAKITSSVGGFPKFNLKDIPNYRVDKSMILLRNS